MKLLVTGDNHLDFLNSAKIVVSDFLQIAASHKPDAVVNLGDLTNGKVFTNRGLEAILGNDKTLYVLGNHDLWSCHERSKLPPDKSFKAALERLKHLPAIPLEKSFSDEESVWEKPELDCTVVGTMGFPDFTHPMFVMPKKYYDMRCCTNDGTYISLSQGWLLYTDQIIESFTKRLSKAMLSKSKEVVVAAHYPFFEGQSRLSGDNVSAYFFCHRLGQLVLKVAAENKSKRFWCIAAHSHDYCRGELTVEAENVASYGLVAEYGRLTFAAIDTDLGFNQEPVVQWVPEKCNRHIGAEEREP